MNHARGIESGESESRRQRDSAAASLTAADIPFGQWAPAQGRRSHRAARSKDAIIVDLLHQLVLARRKAETWRALTQATLDVMADVTADRDRIRRRYHALLVARRRDKAGL